MSDEELFGIPETSFDPMEETYGAPPDDNEDIGAKPLNHQSKEGFNLSVGNKIALVSLAVLVIACLAYADINAAHNRTAVTPPAYTNAAPTAQPTSERWREISDIGTYEFEQTMEQVFTVKGTRRYVLSGSVEPQLRLVAYGSLAAFDGVYEIEIPLSALDKMEKGFQFTVKVDVYSREGRYVVENPRAR